MHFAQALERRLMHMTLWPRLSDLREKLPALPVRSFQEFKEFQDFHKKTCLFHKNRCFIRTFCVEINDVTEFKHFEANSLRNTTGTTASFFRNTLTRLSNIITSSTDTYFVFMWYCDSTYILLQLFVCFFWNLVCRYAQTSSFASDLCKAQSEVWDMTPMERWNRYDKRWHKRSQKILGNKA